MEWTSETIARLQELWQQGLSTAEIGRKLEITKNAVVGKAHRLGLPARPSPIRAGSKTRETVAIQQEESPLRDAANPQSSSDAKPARRKSNVSVTQDTAPTRKAKKPSKAESVTDDRASRSDAPKPIIEKPREEGGVKSHAARLEKAQDGQPSPAMPTEESAAIVKTAAPRKAAAEKELRPLLRPLNVDIAVRKGPSCCWPFGDPGTPEFRFCGAKPVPGKPYCAEHCAVAYVKLRDRRDGSSGGSNS